MLSAWWPSQMLHTYMYATAGNASCPRRKPALQVDNYSGYIPHKHRLVDGVPMSQSKADMQGEGTAAQAPPGWLVPRAFEQLRITWMHGHYSNGFGGTFTIQVNYMHDNVCNSSCVVNFLSMWLRLVV